MGPLDALLHAANFFAPALGLGALAALLSKLFWWRDLRGVSWWRLTRWATLGGTLALIGGLLAFGRDGKMLTYGAMIVLSALGLAWAGWRNKP
jgi:hypothetical protein